MEVLQTKHPDVRPPIAASLDLYPDRPPELVPVDITDDTVTEVAGQLSVGAGPGTSPDWPLLEGVHQDVWFAAPPSTSHHY